NITYPDNTVFNSMFFYDASIQSHQVINSVNTPLPSGKGFELYLLSTPTTFEGATIDYRGTPNLGTYSSDIHWKWNLIGNPFHAHIAYDSASRHRIIEDEYMIFNAEN